MSLEEVHVAAGRGYLQGALALPKDAEGVVLFAHGSGSSRHSRRNRWVAQALFEAGIGSLLFDLLAPVEEEARFDIGLLAERLAQTTRWLADLPEARGLRIG